MNSKEIKELQDLMLHNKEWLNINSSARKLYEEMSLRNMIMSCLTYGGDIFTSTSMDGTSPYHGQPYANKYIDMLGYDRVMEIYNDQKEYFETKCKVEKNVHTDYEGVTYNSLVEVE